MKEKSKLKEISLEINEKIKKLAEVLIDFAKRICDLAKSIVDLAMKSLKTKVTLISKIRKGKKIIYQVKKIALYRVLLKS